MKHNEVEWKEKDHNNSGKMSLSSMQTLTFSAMMPY